MGKRHVENLHENMAYTWIIVLIEIVEAKMEKNVHFLFVKKYFLWLNLILTQWNKYILLEPFFAVNSNCYYFL